MLTLLEIIKRTTDYFSARGIESPRLNAELLIGHALGRGRMQLYLEFERPLTEEELERVRPLVKRRALHEPLQYIIGRAEFGGVTLKLDRRVLIPRPETEYLVEIVLKWCEANPPAGRILELGTGSGAIALALAQASATRQVLAVDRSTAALALAEENARGAGLAERVTLACSDWYADVLVTEFDAVVANPPYLSAEELSQAPTEVREFEPTEALVAADDGCADLTRIIRGAPRYLRRGGLLALETGSRQHERLLSAVQVAGFSKVESARDLAQRSRFILAVW